MDIFPQGQNRRNCWIYLYLLCLFFFFFCPLLMRWEAAGFFFLLSFCCWTRHGFHVIWQTVSLHKTCSVLVLPCCVVLYAAAIGTLCLCVNDFPLVSEGQVMLGVVGLSSCSPEPLPLCSSMSQWLCSAGGRFGAVGGLPWPFLCWPKVSLLLSARCTLNTGSLLSYHSSSLLQYNYFWCTQKSRERGKNKGPVLQWNRLSTKTLNHKHFLKTSSDSSEGAEETLIEEWHNTHP